MGGVQAAEQEGKAETVYWIPLNNTIEQGLTTYLTRTFQEAEEASAAAIVVEMRTLGGEVGAALDIGQLIARSPVPVTVFIRGEAISAGAYIALNAPTIVMTKDSAIGAAEPRLISGEAADPKTVAAWSSKMRSAAEANGRDGDIAAGMVDRNVVIKGLKEKGSLISLSAEQAVKLNIADRLADEEADVLDTIGLPQAKIVKTDLTLAEKVARFLTSPFVIPILFTIGLVGIAVELFTPGFGIAGGIGVTAFALYFFGHFIAGFAGAETFVLFVIGIVLLVVELFVPGFGLFGILGIISLGTGIARAAYDSVYVLIALSGALLVALVVLFVVIRLFGGKGAWRKFVLTEKQDNEAGYVAASPHKDLLGKQGQTVTPLRPAGAAKFETQRIDVVSDGSFIAQGEPVVVVAVDGTKVVVRRSADDSQ